MNWLRIRTPLAWRNLTHKVRRLLLAAGGIGFAVLLIFMQLGFQGALFDSVIQVPRSLNADLVMVAASKYTITIKETFSRRRLSTALSCPGVAAVRSLYYDNRFAWKNMHTGSEYQIRVLAFDPQQQVLLIPEVNEQQAKLLLPGTVLFDRLSKSDYGNPTVGSFGEYAGKRMQVVGMFSLGTDFANDANLFMSDTQYVEAIYPPVRQRQALEQIDMGLIQLAPGADPKTVLKQLRLILPIDVKVMTKGEFVGAERDFWRVSTPIGYVFSFGVVLGFLVGVIICYQILYADISDHLREYATLKAMGYRSLFFTGVVLEEALLLSLFGFLPALVLSELLYRGLGSVTGLLLQLTVERAFSVLGLTMAMCVVSGLLTIRKVLSADPAELFA
jgi:putative ABC transport system permease protein